MDMGWNIHFGSPVTTWVELLVMKPRLGQTLWRASWVQLLVPRAGLDKHVGALEDCGLSY